MGRRPLLTDLAFIVAGIVGLGILWARFAFPLHYPAGDVRSESWFYPVTTVVLALFALFFVAVGIVRFWRRRDR